ncbi:MAG: M1 family metallopeptidase [Gemmatimonadota bacterium]|nr:M1 family metallopeptidase [Gemmatimonadota bacterium]
MRRPTRWRTSGLASVLAFLGVVPVGLTAQAEAGGAADYWQQEAHYTIEASLNEAAERLEGAGSLVYHNRSPDVLDEVYFHLYLNAFRPNSRWAEVEEREEYDFQSLEDPDYGYERLRSMRMEGETLTPEYPFAPDSTVVRFSLPEPIEPGEMRTFTFEWRARPATLCRRQCREGRSWDFAQWYPRIAVYDEDGWQGHPLHPQGEFYGEYGIFDVTLDLAEDQVVGATGAVLEGDPGWKLEPTSPVDVVRKQSSWYVRPREPVSPGFLSSSVTEGRKRVRFYGEDIHHFAWSTSPEYRYEAGRHGDVAVHVLYRPGDVDWDLGAAVNRSIRALEWLETIFGPYPYPQITNLHRLESGGTEFPMLVMDGSPGQGLIVHEFAHQYAMGIFGSNEWKDAWMDEGMASFLGNWFMEEVGGIDPWSRAVRGVGQMEARGLPVPVATPSHEMPSYDVYGLLSYTKPAIVLRMLRELVGADTMREGLALYYERKAFEHVVEDDLRRAIEDASGRDLEWFFEQWLHTTATLDYGVSDVRTEETAGGWRTTATVTRRGEAWMPVTVGVGAERILLEGREREQTVEVVTEQRPEAVVVDPDVVLLDSDPSNNRVAVGG